MFDLISNAQIYAPKPLGLGFVLCCAGKIVYVGTERPDLGVGLALKEHDLEGRMLLPGLIDGHAHITGGGGETGYASRVPTVPLGEFTSAGITSVVGLLGTDDISRSTSSLIAATMALREEGLNAWCYTGGYHYPLTLLTDSASSDIFHVECIIGIGELAISDHRSSHLSCEELLRIAGQAHVAGLMTGKAGILHLHLGDGRAGMGLIRQALDTGDVPARTYNPTHINRLAHLFEEACELVERGCFVDLTAFPVAEKDPGYSVVEAVRRYVDKGLPLGKLTVSSDGGGCLPVFDHRGEIQKLDFARCSSLSQALGDLLNSGLTAETVIALFTRNVANLLRLRGKGVIEVGADADLISLDERNGIEAVMCRGVWHLKSHKLLKRGLFQ